MAEMRVMGSKEGLKALLREFVPESQIVGGDTKVIWDADNEVEVAAARRTFQELKRKGFNAYSVGAKGAKGEMIDDFDPDAEKLIMAPAMAGG